MAGGIFDDLLEQAKNPASPAGLSQGARAAAGVAGEDPNYSQSSVGQWVLDQGFADASQTWFTGQNTEGTGNGWDTAFWNDSIDAYNAAAKAGQLNTQFENPEYATGVVTWDHKSTDGTKDFAFGDIYQGGEFKGNVYSTFDKQTADLMMGQLLFDGKDLGRFLAAGDDLATLSREVQAEREKRTTEIPKALQAQQFEQGVQAREDTFGTGADIATVVAGTTGGATTGGATGAALTAWLGPGALVGGVVGGTIGGVVGGVGAWLNRDEIQEQAARGLEMVELAKREEGTGAAVTTGLQQGAGLVSSLTSPTTQLVHGLADTKRGDDESGFYAVDEQGNAKRGVGWQALGLGAAISDGVMQFASPLNRGIYVAQMGGQVGGEAGTLIQTGKMFDPREGGFDNIFRDDQGNADPTSAAAGILKIGIDAVQMTGWGALGRSAARARAVAAGGAQQVEYGAWRYVLDDAGNAISRERTKLGTLSLLAPSEQVTAITANRAARVRALSEGRAVSADDFYRASRELANNGRRLKGALVNAFGEGWEELAQGLLEPVAMDGAINPHDLAMSFFYGAAGGLGMSLGATMGPSTTGNRQYQTAAANYAARYGTELTREEFDSWDENTRQIMSMIPKGDAKASADAIKEASRAQAATMVATERNAAYAMDARRLQAEKELRTGSGQTDQYTRFSGRVSMGEVSETGARRGTTLRAEAITASAQKIAWTLAQQLDGRIIQETTLKAELATLDPASAEFADLSERLTAATAQRMVGEQVLPTILEEIRAIYASPDAAEATARIHRLNATLERAFAGRANYAPIEGLSQEEMNLAAAQFFSVLYAREPKLHSGGYPIFLPQIDVDMTLNREDELYLVNMDVLQAIGGDFDGDMLRAEHQLVLPTERWRQLRAGQTFGGVGQTIDIATRNFDEAMARALGDGLTAQAGSDLRKEADATMAAITKALVTRYGSMMSVERMDAILKNFRTRTLAGLNGIDGLTAEDQRTGLLNELAAAAGEKITELGKRELNNEWLWISQVVRANLQSYQRQFVKLRTPISEGPSTEVLDLDHETDQGVNARKSAAVNDAQTLAIFAYGNSLFRKFQKIHYSVYNAAVLTAESTDPADLLQMAQLYAELGRDVTRAELEVIGAPDTIAGRVQVMLSRLVDDALRDPNLAGKFNPATAMSVLANIKVRDVDMAENGEPFMHEGDISLAQLLLKRALEQERAEYRNIFDRDEALQKKHARLRPLTMPSKKGEANAEKAFFEVFKSVPFGDLLGSSTGALSPSTTPEQWVQTFIGQDFEARRDLAYVVKNMPEYLSRKESTNLPYSMSEMNARAISGYRSTVDVLLAVGYSYLNFDPSAARKGQARAAFSGSLAEQNFMAQDDFLAVFADVKSALKDYRSIFSGSKADLGTNAEIIQRMAEEDPRFGRSLMALIPPGMVNAVFEDRDGTLYMSPWVFEMFALNDANEALMYFWRNLTLASWNATLVTVNEEDDRDTVGRRYEKLDSRFLRLLYDLNTIPGRLELDLVFRKMHQSKNIDEFFVWLNSEVGIRPMNEAAYLPFVDDVSTFSADSAGGWVAANTSANQRLALSTLRQSAEALRRTMSDRIDRQPGDTVRLDAVQRALDMGDKAAASDKAELRRFNAVLKMADELPRGFGMQAMRELTRAAAIGFGPQSHTKGVTAPAYAPIGETQALQDAFGFVPALERLMESVTANSISSLRSNLRDLASQRGTAMDASGRQIEWAPLDAQTAIDMLRDPRTEPLALALLTPSALETTATGLLVDRPLFINSLSDLMDGTSFKEVFPQRGQRPTLNQAMRYLLVVDSRARKEGGDFSALRYVNDLVITRLTGLDHTVDEFEVNRITDQAYIDTAYALQSLGELMASRTSRDSGMLTKLREAGLAMLRDNFTSRMLPGLNTSTNGDPGPIVTELLDGFKQAERAKQIERLAELAKKYKGKELKRRTKVITEQFNENIRRIDALAEGDRSRQIVTMYQLTGDATLDLQVKARIADAVIGSTNFTTRSPSQDVEDAVTEIGFAVARGERPEFSDKISEKHWRVLGQAAMGIRLMDETVTAATHIASLPFPDAPDGGDITKARSFKYYDRTFGYLASQLLDENSPLTAAAEWLHRAAGRGTVGVNTEAMTKVLANSVLNTKSLGTWSEAHVTQILETHERIDSSAAPAAIAMAGNGPKRWAAIMAATRATDELAGVLDRITVASIPAETLFADDTLREFEVTPFGSTTPRSMAVQALSNRFYSGVKVNGTEIPLDYDNMGFTWDSAVADPGLRYIALPRLREGITRYLKANQIDEADATIELSFLHPDSMPADQANSGWFEGKGHTLLPDGSESLLATLWSDTHGEIEQATQDPLTALKKAMRAISPFKAPDREAIVQANALAMSDLSATLRAKVALVLATPQGGSRETDPEHYNALYKAMKLSHIVVGLRNGERVALTAEQVIEKQLAGADLELDEAKLVVLSPDVLRSMLGDTSGQGAIGYTDEDYLLNPSLLQPYTMITSRMLQRFGDGWFADKGAIGDTSLVSVAAARTVALRNMDTVAERDKRRERLTYFSRVRSQVHNARANDSGLKRKDLQKNFQAMVGFAKSGMTAERSDFPFSSMGVDMIDPKLKEAMENSKRVLDQLAGTTRSGWERAWRLSDTSQYNVQAGELSVESLSENLGEPHRIVSGDMVMVDLTSFRAGPDYEKRIENVLTKLVNTGATVVLYTSDGSSDRRFEASVLLTEMGYQSVGGSRHVFQPREFSRQSQTVRAYESTLRESRSIKPVYNIVSFMAVDPIGTDENTALINVSTRKLRDRKAVNNLLPSSTYPGYNIAVDDTLDNGPYSRTLRHLRVVLDPGTEEGQKTRAALIKAAEESAEMRGVKSIEDALDTFYDKITRTSSLAPRVGDTIEVGDIIPFVDHNGRVIFYRHGLRAPKWPSVQAMQKVTEGIAMAKTERDPLVTANTGTITRIDNRAGYGRQIGLSVPLQLVGDKVQLEWNGMKYVVVRPPESQWVPEVDLGRNGLQVDIYSDVASADSKEAFEGRINNHRNALAFFGFDFLTDMTEFFYPGQDPTEPNHRQNVLDLLQAIADNSDLKVPTSSALDLARATTSIGALIAESSAAFPASDIASDWADRLHSPASATEQIAQAMIIYLMTPHAELRNVLSTPGFFHSQAESDALETRLVPGLFADLLGAHGQKSAVHAELIRRYNARLTSNPDGSGYRLHPNWLVEAFGPGAKGKRQTLRGFLQFGEAHSSGDNPVLSGQSYDPASNQLVSPHNALAAWSSVGAFTPSKALAKTKAFAASFKRGNKIAKFSGSDPDSMWEMLTWLPADAKRHVNGWRRETAGETHRRKAARDEIVGLFHELNTDDWSAEERREYETIATSILEEMNLYGVQGVMVDSWVRQRLGAPHAIVDGQERGRVSATHAIEAANKILLNVRDHLLPTYGGMIPLMDVGHLTTIFMMNRDRSDSWAPREGMGQNAPLAGTWDAWTEVAFGSAWAPGDVRTSPFEPKFDPLFQLAIDGLMHGYQRATEVTRSLPVSTDLLRMAKLMEPETEKMLVSLSEDENRLVNDPVIFNTTLSTLDSIIAGQRIYGNNRDYADPLGADGSAQRKIERWRREVDAPDPQRKNMRGIRAGGQTFLGRTTETSAAWRMALNLRAANTLLNPALIVSAPVEAWYRRTIDLFSMAVSGQSTGVTGKAFARLSEKYGDTTIGKVAELIGFSPTYTASNLKQMDLLIEALGTQNTFKSEIYKELMFQYPTIPGIGRVEKALEKFAKLGGRLQDPAWGMRPNDLSRHYMQAVMRAAVQPGRVINYSVDRLLTEMARDPLWVMKNDLEAHNMGIAAIANVRSLKANVVSLATRGIVDPLASSPKFARNNFGNFLKLMTMFQNFWSGFAINALGMQGAADMAAFLVDGRQKKLGLRIQKALRGDTQPNFELDEAEFYDMSEVLESLDLADAFIKSGVTHSALFLFGMMAGGLGLSGDDDEEKRRRRAAELQGGGMINDPQKLQNDFRNRDAIFLDLLPNFISSYFRVPDGEGGYRSVAQMNWVARTFLSPIVGMERFYETGDFTEVVHGFQDAIGSHPIVNQALWGSVTDTVAELHNSALMEMDQGGPENHAAAAHLLVTAVGIMDRALFENAFVNMIYQGVDEYDRDPYKQPKLDSDGNPQVDVKGNPYGTDALRQFVDEQGNVQGAYVDRSTGAAQFRSLTENRFTLAMLGSLYTGLSGDGFASSDMFRYNMPVKTRTVELQPTNVPEVSAYLLAAFQGTQLTDGGQHAVMNLSEAEAADLIKNAYKARGEWYDEKQVEAQAKRIASGSGLALSTQTADGRENLTEAGTLAIFDGLRHGTLTLTDHALDGVYISLDQRYAIRDQWMKELVAEGVEMGLDNQTATSRMKRIMFGPLDDADATGLYDILFTDQIPISDTLEYNQLNTTYVIGPDGRPWATGFTRDGLLGALGIRPFARAIVSTDTNLPMDSRMNTVDSVAGVNTGLRGLERRGEGWEIRSTEEEIRAASEKIADAIGEAAKSSYSPYGTNGSYGSSYGGWRSYGGYGGGGGGGGYYGGSTYFLRMNPLPDNISVYGNSVPFINTSNPIIRRADVRRERVWSERGRLLQWQ